MSLREAAEMALEWMRDEGIEWIGKGEEVKKALRAALAEAEVCTYPDCKCPIDKGEACAMGKAEAPKAESAGAELSSEQMRALRESHCYDAEDRYFKARPVSDSATSRKAFTDGFERGWDAALAAARS